MAVALALYTSDARRVDGMTGAARNRRQGFIDLPIGTKINYMRLARAAIDAVREMDGKDEYQEYT